MRKLLRVKPAGRYAGAAVVATAATHIVYCPPSDLSSIVASVGAVLREALVKHGMEDGDGEGRGSVGVPLFVGPDAHHHEGDAAAAVLAPQTTQLPPAGGNAAAAVGAKLEDSSCIGSGCDTCEVVSIAWTAGAASDCVRAHRHSDSVSHGRQPSEAVQSAMQNDGGESASPTWPPGAEVQAYLELQEQLDMLAASGTLSAGR